MASGSSRSRARIVTNTIVASSLGPSQPDQAGAREFVPCGLDTSDDRSVKRWNARAGLSHPRFVAWSGRHGVEPRQRDAEGRTATLLALDLDRPAVGVDDGVRDGQSEARSAVPSRSVRPDSPRREGHDRSKRFYTEGLGWKVQRDYKVSVFFEPDGGSLVGFYGREGLAAQNGVSPEGSGFRGLVLTPTSSAARSGSTRSLGKPRSWRHSPQARRHAGSGAGTAVPSPTPMATSEHRL
jgi:catechol 2,3-dioxygenase-like lactoylglutathione lyase family enzyme